MVECDVRCSLNCAGMHLHSAGVHSKLLDLHVLASTLCHASDCVCPYGRGMLPCSQEACTCGVQLAEVFHWFRELIGVCLTLNLLGACLITLLCIGSSGAQRVFAYC